MTNIQGPEPNKTYHWMDKQLKRKAERNWFDEARDERVVKNQQVI